MRLRPLTLLVVTTWLSACGPGKNDSETEATSDPSDGSTASGTTASTTDDPTASSPQNPTASPTEGTGTTELPTDPPSFCAPGPCVTKIEYSCEAEIGGPCNDPCDNLESTDCGGPDLCPPITIRAGSESEEYEVVESEIDALCVLEALRDRTPGRLHIRWGDPNGVFGDAGVAIAAKISLNGSDVIRMDWEWEVHTCCLATYARIRRTTLQPPAFFDDCLTEPDTAKLIACFTAGSTAASPAPDDWLPPWVVNACDPSLPDTCGE